MSLSATDFNLHGLVGIRVLGGRPADVAAVRRQLGPLEGPLAGEPDVTIRFVERLPVGPLRLLGLQDAGFSDDAFLVLRSKGKTPARVQIPMDQVGGRCEIVCERGLPAVPLLIPIINLTALARGALPLHAAAFLYNDCGTLVTGWSKGGKTETLLAFMAHGATYVGDEWVYVHGDGRRLSGIPEPVRVWDWHLPELPQFRARLARSQRLRLAALRPVLRIMGRMAEGSGRLSRQARRLLPLVRQQHGVNVPPQRLFGQRESAASVPLDRLFLVISQETEEVSVCPISGREVAQRMLYSLLEEYQPFLAYYWKFRFAFPGRANEMVDCLAQVQERALAQALAGREAYAVYHPYPVPIGRLFTAMEPYFQFVEA